MSLWVPRGYELVDAADGSLTWTKDTAALTVEPALQTPAALRTIGATGFFDHDPGAALTNSSTETTLYSSSGARPALPANSVEVGDLFRFTALGTYTNNTGAGQTVQFKIILGTFTIATLTTGSLSASALPRGWVLQSSFAVTDNTALGDIAHENVLQGTAVFSSSEDTAWKQVSAGSLADVFDFTTALTFDCTGKHSAASANLTLAPESLILEKMHLAV